MKIKPLRDQVLIESIKEEVKKGGIILPDTITKERPEQGKITAVGESVKSVKKNDKVIFAKYGIDGGNVSVVKLDDGKEVYLVNEGSILAVIE